LVILTRTGEKDFDEAALSRYQQNLANGLIERYLSRPGKKFRLVSLA